MDADDLRAALHGSADAIDPPVNARRAVARRVSRRRAWIAAVGALVVVVMAAGVTALALDRPDDRLGLSTEGGTSTTAASTTTSSATEPEPDCEVVPTDQSDRQPAPRAPSGWNPLPASPIGSRTFAAEVWTGTELIVWGGEAGAETNLPSSGAAYNPTTRTWRRIADGPEGRAETTAVWTGTEMLVWGGSFVNGTRRQDVGFAYDPAADAWRGTPAAPIDGTEFAASVWTGHEMIVVAGSRGGGVEQSQAVVAYDPCRNRWRRLPDLPYWGRFPTAVWTGREVIVWGGQDPNNPPVSQGAALDPTTGRWRRLPAAPVQGFYHHSAVWTGTEMVLWGWVHGTTGQENEAAAYDPGSNTWRELPSAPLRPPEPCECNGGQSAVWADGVMLAWSGTLDADGPLLLSLDPATGAWQRLQVAPDEASYHPPMIWTGSSAILDAILEYQP